MQPFAVQRQNKRLQPRSSEWRERCKIDLRTYMAGVMDNEDKFIQEIWNANAVTDGFSRLLLPLQYRNESEAIGQAYKWAALKIPPDKHGEENWERRMAWDFINSWHKKEMFWAQK